MAKTIAKQIDPAEIDAKALSLAKLVKRNEERKPEDRVDHSVSVIIEDDRALMVCGSAHMMVGMFVELLKQRPEFRQVMEDAVRKYGQNNSWKL